MNFQALILRRAKWMIITVILTAGLWWILWPSVLTGKKETAENAIISSIEDEEDLSDTSVRRRIIYSREHFLLDHVPHSNRSWCEYLKPSFLQAETKIKTARESCTDFSGITFFNFCSQNIRTTLHVTTTTDFKTLCDFSVCHGDTIFLGHVQPETGNLVENFTKLTGKPDILPGLFEDYIREYQHSLKLEFIVVSCHLKERGVGRQFLPLISRTFETPRSLPRDIDGININIILLDSISRSQIIRELPMTINTLQDLNIRSPGTILDFRLFNSLGRSTYPNLRSLFTGEPVSVSEINTNSYGLKRFFKPFHDKGFFTLLQEDGCWLDRWGIILGDTLKPETDDKNQLWRKIQDSILDLSLASVGMTMMSCFVFNQYNKTNQFNGPPSVCLDGIQLHAFFFDFVHHFNQLNSRNPHSRLLTYTHLCTAHETTGKRVRLLDPALSDAVRAASEYRNTMTIFMSDHGPKTTATAQQSMDGRLDLSDAVLFMLIDEEAQRNLGVERWLSLSGNTERLVTMSDVHNTLMSLADGGRRGLLEDISPNRTCADIIKTSYTPCKCLDWYTFYPTQSPALLWLAEFALGRLNNHIHKSYRRSSQPGSAGFGRCRRLLGKLFERIRAHQGVSSTLYLFDVTVQGYDRNELFEMSVEDYGDHVKIASSPTRVSVFQPFAACADTGVQVHDCVCDTRSLVPPLTIGAYVDELRLIGMFDRVTTSTTTSIACVHVLERHVPQFYSSFELVSRCLEDHWVTVSATCRHEVRWSVAPPFQVTVHSQTIHFLTSVSFAFLESWESKYEDTSPCRLSISFRYTTPSKN